MYKSKYVKYSYNDFIKTISVKVDILNAKCITEALPIFVQETDTFKQKFTVTVYRDINDNELRFTMFLGEGKIAGETSKEEKFKYIIGDFIIADILDETIKNYISKDKLDEIEAKNNIIPPIFDEAGVDDIINAQQINNEHYEDDADFNEFLKNAFDFNNFDKDTQIIELKDN